MYIDINVLPEYYVNTSGVEFRTQRSGSREVGILLQQLRMKFFASPSFFAHRAGVIFIRVDSCQQV